MSGKNTSNKKIVAIVLIVIGLLSSVFGILGLTGGGGMDPYDARNGVVLVAVSVTDSSSGASAAGTGTGWAIGKPGKPVEYIITNGHVVEMAYVYPQLDSAYSGNIRVIFNAAENDYVVPEVVYYSAPEDKDIAILKLPSATDKRTPLSIRSSDKVEIGEDAWALGYPGISSDFQQYNTFSPEDITLTRGIISKRNRPTGSQYEAYQMDVYINGGNSGGPLVDKNGNVIGINSAGIHNSDGGSEGVNYAIISDELTKILDSEGITYTKAGGISWTKPWMGYVFLPIGIILLVGGAFTMVKTQKDGTSGASANKGKKAKGLPLKGGSGKSGNTPVLRGVTGKYAGQSFNLSNGRVTIGRDASVCNIVYDKNMPGISGRHCQVAYQPGEGCFIITDLGSSYGTFLGNGKKLTANVAEKLSSGDTFYLCDTGNQFVVTKE